MFREYKDYDQFLKQRFVFLKLIITHYLSPSSAKTLQF